MTIEEKAKAYDEALKVLHKYDGANIMFSQDLKEEMFPELKESKDEQIRKALIKSFEIHDLKALIIPGFSAKDVIAWLKKKGEKIEPIEGFNAEFERQVSHLIASSINKDYEYTASYVKWVADALLNYAKQEIEKQDEQKSAWSEEDEEMLETAISSINQESVMEGLKSSGISYSIDSSARLMKNLIDWLKSLKDRVQPKQEWSEEDEEMLEDVKFNFQYNKGEMTDAMIAQYNRFFNKIKSLKPQSKQEWSKKDEEMLKYFNELLDYAFKSWSKFESKAVSALDWLGSLKERVSNFEDGYKVGFSAAKCNQWNPSDEQMKGIECAIKTLQHQLNVGDKRLNLLYDDLKKLMGE